MNLDLKLRYIPHMSPAKQWNAGMSFAFIIKDMRNDLYQHLTSGVDQQTENMLPTGILSTNCSDNSELI